MPVDGFDNGAGSGGGNGSTWWQLRHGSESHPQQMMISSAALAGRDMAVEARPVVPGAKVGDVKVKNGNNDANVQVHDETDWKNLGAQGRLGMFRVRLRISRDQWEALKTAAGPRKAGEFDAYWKTLEQVQALLNAHIPRPSASGLDWDDKTDNDLFLMVDVPAIKRERVNDDTFDHMPWEIFWTW